MAQNENSYRSYLIRFLRGAGEMHWRVVLQDVQTAQTIRFSSEQELFSFLSTQLQQPPSNDRQPES